MPTLNSITAFFNDENIINNEKLDRVFDELYPEIKRIANIQLAKIVKTPEMSPTSLVNECYLKLQKSVNIDMKNRKHFYSLVSRCMRFYLIDLIRKQYTLENTSRTDFSITQITTDESYGMEILELDEALNRLEILDKNLMNIVEMRFFGGFSLDEIADVLKTNKSDVYRQWLLAKSLLMNLIDEGSDVQK